MMKPGRPSRRAFLAGLAASAGLSGGAGGCLGPPHRMARGVGGVGTGSSQRAIRAYEIRHAAALRHRRQTPPDDAVNGDDARYLTRLASYSKGLRHNDRGEVDARAYDTLLAALTTGRARDFQQVPLGDTGKLVNPQAAYTFTLQGADSSELGLRPAPAFASPEAAGELVELYWQAALRDMPFKSFDHVPLARAAADDLSRLSDFRGPRNSGRVTPTTLFRGQAPGDLNGPYVSQFLYGRVPQGVYTLEQRFRQPVAGRDFLVEPAEWLAIQNGGDPTIDSVLETERRYIRNGRDLARYVQRDFSFQAFLNAALMLLAFGESYLSPTPYMPRACGLIAPRDGHGPRLVTEAGFSTFGGPQVLDAVTAVANLALRATWRHKWLLHRRLRPEEFAHRVDRQVRHGEPHPLHADLLKSVAVQSRRSASVLLPSAYAEGAPLHPSYPAGHAAIAGACVTVLKCFFRQDAPFPGPVEPTDDGLGLTPIRADLSVGGELNKLASNISIGRNWAGVHYRSDGVEGMRLGEAVALAYLADIQPCLTEPWAGFSLTTFDGAALSI